MSDQELRPATPDDVDDMALVLADAFHDDPVFTWMFPDPATRPRRLEAMFTLIGRHLYVGQGECLVGQHAASYWEPPGAPDSAELWGDHAEELVTAMEGEVERLGALGAAMAAFHPDEPCWYLAVLGVRSSAQGRGLGGALLARKLEQIDAAGEAAYLEATSPRNRALYERHGFELVQELRAADDAPPMFAMWREPQRR